MRARHIQEIGTMAWLRIYWDRVTLLEVYPDGSNRRSKNGLECRGGSYHNAMTLLGQTNEKEAWGKFGTADNYREDHRWPTKCQNCGAPVPEASYPTLVGQSGYDVNRQIFTERWYDTASGKPEPGDIYEIAHWGDYECPYWDNCSGLHTIAVLPTGEIWDMDTRASNCTRKEDRTHRCWVKHGTAQAGTLHVDKNGDTCAAGAGSIASKNWHGFLHRFEFVG